MTTGICFFISIFFAPIFASIPAWATGCTLILVGAMMARACTDINWRYTGDSIPAFVTMAVMPFTYSIAYGLIAGIFTYIILNGTAYVLRKASGGRITPHDYDNADGWSYKVKGGILPGWLKRAARGKKDFWREHEEVEYVEEDKRSGSAGEVHALGTPEPAALTGDKEWEQEIKTGSTERRVSPSGRSYRVDVSSGTTRNITEPKY